MQQFLFSPSNFAISERKFVQICHRNPKIYDIQLWRKRIYRKIPKPPDNTEDGKNFCHAMEFYHNPSEPLQTARTVVEPKKNIFSLFTRHTRKKTRPNKAQLIRINKTSLTWSWILVFFSLHFFLCSLCVSHWAIEVVLFQFLQIWFRTWDSEIFFSVYWPFSPNLFPSPRLLIWRDNQRQCVWFYVN